MFNNRFRFILLMFLILTMLSGQISSASAASNKTTSPFKGPARLVQDIDTETPTVTVTPTETETLTITDTFTPTAIVTFNTDGNPGRNRNAYTNGNSHRNIYSHTNSHPYHYSYRYGNIIAIISVCCAGWC